eukprot:532359_1
MTHVLWLLKFEQYSGTKISPKSRYIPQKGFDFLERFNTLIESYNDYNITLIYLGSNGPYLIGREQTDLPTKEWDMTMITKHDANNNESLTISLDQFKNSKNFNKMKNEFGIEIIYNVCFKMDNQALKFLDKHYDKIKSLAPSYPYPSLAYEWLANNDNIKQINQYIKLLKYIDEPFVMLNLMQIIDEKSDKFYSRKVTPLVNGTGARALIIGDAKCMDNHYWTQILMVMFPNTKRYWNLWTSKYYLPIAKLKLKSTKDILLQMTMPIYCDPKYAEGKLRSKL